MTFNNASNYLKTPIAPALARIAQLRAQTEIAKLGYDLPCSVVSVNGAIVTVKFELNTPGVALPQIKVPIVGSEYIRLPIQVGCKGLVRSADAYLGGMSGLGGGVATLTRRTNLSALVFEPIGNVDWFGVDGTVLTMYGPNGVTLMDEGKTTFVKLSSAGTVEITAPESFSVTAGGHNITISSAGVVIDGVVFGTHEHTGVQVGGGKTAGPVNP